METLFKTIEEVRQYISVDISSDFRTIKPYIKQAEKYILDVIGKPLYDDLYSVVHKNNDHEALKELLEKVRLPLANFGYMLAIAKLNVNVGDSGFTVTSTQSLVPASEWRIRDFRESVQESGNDALEWLIFYLEENAHSFPKWAQSKAYSYQNEFYVNNAQELHDAIYLEIKRTDFLKLKPFIFQTEKADILPVVGERLTKVLKKEILSTTLTHDNEYLLNNYIRPAACYLALHKFQPNENYKLEGARYLAELQEYLNTTANKYPDYKISPNYTDPSASKTGINTATSGFYVMQ